MAYALNKMSVGRFRHVPLVDADGAPVGMISIRDIVDFIVELCPEEILNLPSAARAGHPAPPTAAEARARRPARAGAAAAGSRARR